MPEQAFRTYELSAAALVAGVLAVLVPVCLLGIAFGRSLGSPGCAGTVAPDPPEPPAFVAPVPQPRDTFPRLPERPGHLERST